MCDNLWAGQANNENAKVVCRQLGRAGGQETIESELVSLIQVKFWLDDVQCAGTVAALDLGTHAGWGVHNCTFAERVGVRCLAETDPPMVTGATVDGASLVITFDEDLAAVANLANRAFTVEKTPSGGAEETVAQRTGQNETRPQCWGRERASPPLCFSGMRDAIPMSGSKGDS